MVCNGHMNLDVIKLVIGIYLRSIATLYPVRINRLSCIQHRVDESCVVVILVFVSNTEEIQVRLQFLCPTMVDVNTKASGRSLYDVTHIVELPVACSTILNGSRLDGINYMIQRQTVERQHRVVLFSHFSRLVQRSNIAFKEIRSAVVCHLLYLL